MGDVIDLVLMKTDRAHEVHLDLVASRDRAHEGTAVCSDVLSDREDRRNVVGGV